MLQLQHTIPNSFVIMKKNVVAGKDTGGEKDEQFNIC
jgi:hypothetical protein